MATSSFGCSDMAGLTLRLRAALRSRDGATALETGLVMGLFCMLLFGAIEAGRYYFTYHTVRTIVAEAARQAQVNPALSGCATGNAINSVVRSRTPGNISGLELCFTRSTTNNVTTVVVNATTNFTFVVPFFGNGARTLSERTQTVY